jgi:hypothetical protein
MYLADVIFLAVLAAIFTGLALGPVWAFSRWRRHAPSRVRQDRRRS